MTELTKTKKDYDAKYDIAKFILSLFVIAIHANLYPYALYPWLRIAVPLFFIMSAYFIFSKMQNTALLQQKVILKKYVKRNVLLYVCWFIILLPMTYLTRHKIYFGHGIGTGIRTFLTNLFFGNTFLASWFIPAAVFGVLIVYGFSRLLRKDVFLFIISLLVFGVVTLRSSYMPLFAGTWVEQAFDTYTNVLGNPVLSFPAAILWIFIGKYFAQHKVRIPSWKILVALFVVCCIALFAEWKFILWWSDRYSNDSYFMLLPVCVTLFAMIYKFKPIHWKPSLHLKRASTIIYVSHASILPVCNEITRRILGYKIPLLSFAATICVCVLIYIVLAFLSERCKSYKIGKIFQWMY